MALELQGLVKSFGEVRALDGVSLSVQPGELFTLLGPSGCGKTTLLRTIAGFVQQDAGHVRVGEDLLDGVPPHRRDVGLVFQNYALFPHLSVGENVAFGLEERRLPRAQVDKQVAEALEAVRLTGYGDRRPDQLSGGQRQRVGIARALAIEPRVLLMDEPLSNLDAQLRVLMREEIRALQRAAGRTTVYVTHDQEEALAISDRIAVFEGGRLQQVGTPSEIYRQPANAFVAGFVGRANALPLERLRSVLPGLAPETQCVIRPEDVIVHAASERSISEHALRGTVARTSFLGPVLRAWIECEGLELEVDVHRPDPAALPIGAEVAIELPPDRIHSFPPPQGASGVEA